MMEAPQRALELPTPASAATVATSSSSSSNLRDLLTVRQEEDLRPLYQHGAHLSHSLSLGTVLACEKRDLSSPALPAGTSPSTAVPTGGGRTLLDIIRDEESGGRGGLYDGVIIGASNGGHKINWRAFKDRLRISRVGAAWQSAGPGGGSGVTGHPFDRFSGADLILPSHAAVASASETLEGGAARPAAVPGHNPPSAVSNSIEATRPPTPAVTRACHSSGAPTAAWQQQGSGHGAAAPATAASEEAQPQQPQQQEIRVSLMALLEQTDSRREGPGFAVSALLGAEEEEEEEDEDGEEGDGEEGGEGDGKMYVKCCVCMVRHKGAAFIPCGHTFCRLCSRELWVSRGNCPLCNGFILEILDIF